MIMDQSGVGTLTIPEPGSELWKELINKLAWALGTTYGLPYRDKKGQIRHMAVRLANMAFREGDVVAQSAEWEQKKAALRR